MTTRPFNVHYTCQHCGKQTTAETGFGRWMRAQPELDSWEGIVRTDTDHAILRYKTHKQGRDFQLLMLVETKEYGALPRDDQRDILAYEHQLMSAIGRNMHGGKTILTRKLFSVKNRRTVNVRYMGFHLLRFEKTSPADSAWIEWDHNRITPGQCLQILALNVDPYNPSRPIDDLLRDRHAHKQLGFWDIGHG